MPVLRKTINLTVSGNTLLATDSITNLSTSDAGVQGEDEAILFNVTVPTDWQDLSVRLKVMSQDGGYDLSDLPVANIISMPLRQGLTMASGRLTVSLIGSTTVGVRKSADCKTLTVVASAQEITIIPHNYPHAIHNITGSGGALVTQTDNDTYNVNVIGTGGDMLQANYANGNVNNANTVDVSKAAKSAQAGSALETVIAAKMPTATYAVGTGSANTNKSDHAMYSDHSAGLVGEIKQFAGATAPTSTMLCDGSAILRSTYSALFVAIGTVWGVGDGSTTFNVPNLKGKSLIGLDASQTEFNALAKTGGAKTVTIAAGNLPSTIPVANAAATGSVGSAAIFNSAVYANSGTQSFVNLSINSANTALNNLQPYAVINYIIVF